MASVGAIPIFTATRPANAPNKPTKPTCTSYKDAYDSASWRRGINAAIVLGAFSLVSSIAFQADFIWPFIHLNLRTLLFSIALFCFYLPPLLIRYVNASLCRPVAPSGLAELSDKITSKDNSIILAAYALSGMAIVRFYFGVLVDESYTENLLFHPHGERFGVRQLNQDNLFIYVYGLVLGVSFALKRIMDGKWAFTVSPVQQPQTWALKLSLSTAIHDGSRWAGKTFVYTYIGFIFFSGFVYRLAAHIVSSLYANMLESPVIGFSWFDLYLFARIMLGGCLATFTWEMADRIFDAFFAVNEPITLRYENSHEALLSGLRLSTNPFIQGIAYAELAQLATKSPSQRVALFRDMGKDMNNTAWIQVSRECMNVLAVMRANIEREYTGDKKPAPAPVAKEDKPVVPNRIQLLDMDVIAKPKASTTVLDDRTGKLFAEVSTLVDNTDSTAVVTDAPKDIILNFLRNHAGHFGKWQWFQDMSAVTAERRIRQIFSDYPTILYAIQALGSLTAASINEDPYGLVQRDIGTVLDTLLGSVTDVENLVRSPPPAYKKLQPGYKGDVMLMEPEFVLLALREAIYQIVTGFKDYLDQIRVSGKYLEKWQRFVEFKE